MKNLIIFCILLTTSFLNAQDLHPIYVYNYFGPTNYVLRVSTSYQGDVKTDVPFHEGRRVFGDVTELHWVVDGVEQAESLGYAQTNLESDYIFVNYNADIFEGRDHPQTVFLGFTFDDVGYANLGLYLGIAIFGTMFIFRIIRLPTAPIID